MTAASSRPLTDLLGETRARVLQQVQSAPATAAELATGLQITPAAVRRHLSAMHADGLVEARRNREGGMGRPAERWQLTERGKRLFVDRSADFADDLLDHVQATFGRPAVLEFLKSRNARQADRYAADLAGVADQAERVRLLAESLSADGFTARVEHGPDGRSLTLLQSHCAIEGIAKAHPEICAQEAALFTQVLGARVSRRETIAGGATACVCHIPADPAQSTASPDVSHRSA